VPESSGWSCASTPPYAFMAWCSVRRSTGTTLSFTFTFPPTPSLPSGLLPSSWNFVRLSLYLPMCATCPFHPPWFDHSNNIWWRTQIMKVLVMQFRLLSAEIISVSVSVNIRGCIQKFPDWVDNEIYAYNYKHLLRSNTKGYGGKSH
jgi:hypothetical protein